MDELPLFACGGFPLSANDNQAGNGVQVKSGLSKRGTKIVEKHEKPF